MSYGFQANTININSLLNSRVTVSAFALALEDLNTRIDAKGDSSTYQAAIDSLITDLATELQVRETNDGLTLDAAKLYADQKVSALVNSAPEMYDTLMEIATKLQEDDTALASLLASITTNLQAAKDYADAQDVTNLQAAKTYADAQDAINLQAAKDYTDAETTRATGVEGDLDSAINTEITTRQSEDVRILSEAKTYTNEQIVIASGDLSADISAEETRAMLAESDLASDIAALEASVGGITAGDALTLTNGVFDVNVDDVTVGVSETVIGGGGGTGEYLALAFTSATDPAVGTITSNYDNVIPVWHAVDGIFPDEGYSGSFYSNHIPTVGDPTDVVMHFVSPKTLEAVKIQGCQPSRSPKNFKFQASNNGVDYIDLVVQSNVTNWTQFEIKEYTFSNTTAYSYYRLLVTEVVNAGAAGLQISEMWFKESIGGTPSVTGNQLFVKDSAITEAKLATGSVTTTKIKNANVTNEKLAAGIDATKIADGSVTNAEFQHLSNVTSDIQTQFNNEVTARSSADATLTGDIASEAATRLANDATLQTNIDALNTLKADKTEVTNAINLAQGQLDALSANKADKTYVDTQDTQIRADFATADSTLQSNIDAEAATRLANDATTLADAKTYADQKINDLVNGAPAALDTLNEIAVQLANDESAVNSLITTVGTNLQTAKDYADAQVAAEAAIRLAADGTLQGNIDAEVVLRDAAIDVEKTRAMGVEADIRAEFAAADLQVRSDLITADNSIRSDFAAVDDDIRAEFAAADGSVRADFAAADTSTRSDFAAADSVIMSVVETKASQEDVDMLSLGKANRPSDNTVALDYNEEMFVELPYFNLANFYMEFTSGANTGETHMASTGSYLQDFTDLSVKVVANGINVRRNLADSYGTMNVIVKHIV